MLQAPGLGPAGRPESILSRCLAPFSWVYGRAALWHRSRGSQRALRLDVPVISIGNITCGGTGKTPTVEMVSRDLLGLGRRPAVLSRGYGAPRGGSNQRGASSSKAVPDQGNDEYEVLLANLPDVPQYQGKDRYACGLRAIAGGADVLILDDGFQHVRLARDLDVVLIDGLAPFGDPAPPLGHGRVLPAGLLREPLESLRHAHLFAITRSNQAPVELISAVEAFLAERFPGAARIRLETQAVECRSLDGTSASVESLRGRRLLAFCGIGNPEAFRRQLLALGAVPLDVICFRDHHRYDEGDLRRLALRAGELGAEDVAMTQKDAVKIPATPVTARWKYLRIAQRVAAGADTYRAALDRALSRRRGP